MFLSKYKNGVYYIYYFDSKGNRKSKSTKEKIKTKAYKVLNEFQQSYEQDSENTLVTISLEHFKIKFLAYSETINSIRHTKAIHATLNGIQTYFGDIFLADLTNGKVQSYIELRLKKVSPHAVRRDIYNLSSCFNWAVSKSYLKENLVKGIPKPKLPEKMPLFFTKEEFNVLIKSIDDEDLKDLVEFAVLTGLRQSDLIHLQWKQINLSTKILLLDNRNSLTKSRKIHTLPLSERAIEILEVRKGRVNGENVFTYQSKKILQDFISKKFKKLVKKAELNPKLTFHTLRHTFATWLVQKGVSIYQVSKLMTHSDLRVTQIYAHLQTKDLFDAVNMLD